MSTKKHGVLWEAAPHTIAKIEILRSYLAAWFPIFGRTSAKQDLMYIDGFAGPGEYTNYPEGSPMVALRVAIKVIQNLGDDWKAAGIRLVFMDTDQACYENLKGKLAGFKIPPSIKIDALHTTFVDGLTELKNKIP